MDSKFIFKNLRAHVNNDNQIVLEGFVCAKIMSAKTMQIFLEDDKVYELKFDIAIKKINEKDCFEFCDESIDSTMYLTIKMPKRFSDNARLHVMTLVNSETDEWYEHYCCGGYLIKKCYDTLFCDVISIDNGIDNNAKKNVINGYVAYNKKPEIAVSSSEDFGDSIEYDIQWHDELLEGLYLVEGNKMLKMFQLTVPCSKDAMWVKIKSGNKEYVKRIRPFVKIYKSKRIAKINRYARRTVYSLKRLGIKATAGKFVKKLSPRNFTREISYSQWLSDREPSIIKQSKLKKMANYLDCGIGVIISNNNKSISVDYISESLSEQIFTQFEVLTSKVLQQALFEEKQKYCFVFGDVKDYLQPEALYNIAKCFEEDNPDIIYCDSDNIDVDTGERFKPVLKPDFSIDLIRSYNYIGRIVGISKAFSKRLIESEIFPEINSYEKLALVDTSDYDFILRCVELASNIMHIPMVLYSEGVSSLNRLDNLNKLSVRFKEDYAKTCVRRHLEREGINAVLEHQNVAGMNDIIYIPKEESLVSIIIPNKDHSEDLARCVDSVLSKSLYGNYEIIIVENNSVEPETFEYYKHITEYSSQVKVVYWKGEFNYSAINNFGARAARGDYLLMLNNDTEMIDGLAIYRLLGHCQRDEVGIAGARLLYENGLVQHAGIIIGMGGIAGNAFAGVDANNPTYYDRIYATCNYSAVTAACLMISSKLFVEIGGFDEELGVAFNDVDLCLKVRKHNKLVVYDANVVLHHYESLSRGQEDTEEKLERFYDEIEQFKARWIDILRDGDMYYNKGLSLKNTDFRLAKDNSEVII